MKNRLTVVVTMRHEVPVEIESERNLLHLAMNPEEGGWHELNRAEDLAFEKAKLQLPEDGDVLDYEVEYEE